MELDDNLIRGSECEWPLNCTMTLISFQLLQIFFFLLKIFLCFWEIISVHACQRGFAKISQIRRKSSWKANCQWLLMVYQVIISICSHSDICEPKAHALNKNPLMWGFFFLNSRDHAEYQESDRAKDFHQQPNVMQRSTIAHYYIAAGCPTTEMEFWTHRQWCSLLWLEYSYDSLAASCTHLPQRHSRGTATLSNRHSTRIHRCY